MTSEGEDQSKSIDPGKKNKKLISIIAVVVIIIIAMAGVFYWVTDPDSSTDSRIRDRDGDGVADANDAFPDDASETKDTDNDGYGDNSDVFPYDSSEHIDTDLDGIGNNADFYDYGNGKVKIAITSFRSDGTADVLDSADAYFQILIDANNDGIFEQTQTSSRTDNDDSLSNPFSYIVDLPDSTTQFKFAIKVWDYDSASNDDLFDYCPTTTGYYYTMTVNNPFSDSWLYDGADDYQDNEIDCELGYSISVVD